MATNPQSGSPQFTGLQGPPPNMGGQPVFIGASLVTPFPFVTWNYGGGDVSRSGALASSAVDTQITELNMPAINSTVINVGVQFATWDSRALNQRGVIVSQTISFFLSGKKVYEIQNWPYAVNSKLGSSIGYAPGVSLIGNGNLMTFCASLGGQQSAIGGGQGPPTTAMVSLGEPVSMLYPCPDSTPFTGDIGLLCVRLWPIGFQFDKIVASQSLSIVIPIAGVAYNYASIVASSS